MVDNYNEASMFSMVLNEINPHVHLDADRVLNVLPYSDM